MDGIVTVRTQSADETIAWGKRLGELLAGHEVICLFGELGAGKTAFTQGIALGLGVMGAVTSPTFTLVHEHRGRVRMYHMDLYRLDDPVMVEDLGFDDYLVAGGTVVIEWAERADGYLPEEYLAVRFSRQHGNTHSESWRILEFEPRGNQYRDLLERMIAHANPGD